MELAERDGAYTTYEGSPASQGLLQVQTLDYANIMIRQHAMVSAQEAALLFIES
jgi:hypothetical protein